MGFAHPLRLNGANWVLIKQTTCFHAKPSATGIPDRSSYLMLPEHYSRKRIIYTPITDVTIQTPLRRTQGAAL